MPTQDHLFERLGLNFDPGRDRVQRGRANILQPRRAGSDNDDAAFDIGALCSGARTRRAGINLSGTYPESYSQIWPFAPVGTVMRPMRTLLSPVASPNAVLPLAPDDLMTRMTRPEPHAKPRPPTRIHFT